MRNIALIAALAFLLFTLNSFSQTKVKPFYIGADLSYTPLLEKSDVSFYDNGVKNSTIDIFKNNGWNTVRVRLWYNRFGLNGLDQALKLAQRVKQKKMFLLLDIFYSDGWADINKQPSPFKWADLDQSTVTDSVYNYTRRVISIFKKNNATPDMVQIGNEINHGMLWDNKFRVYNAYDIHFQDLAHLLTKAISAVKVVDPTNKIKIVIAYGGLYGAVDFYQNLKTFGVPFDIMGISYYPAAPNNNLEQVKGWFNNLAASVKKDILVAETAYPYTLKVKDPTVKQALGANARMIPGFPPTPEGQKNFLITLVKIIKQIPGDHGIGFCYYAPDNVAYNGPPKPFKPYSSSWQTQTLFDINSKALPALKLFKKSSKN